MDTVEATKMVMSRIQKLDPENASKIMGYILIQDQGDNEMIRLAFGPENLLISVIKQAKSFLDISSNTSSAVLKNTPQVMIPNNNNGGFHPGSPVSPWGPHGHRSSPSPRTGFVPTGSFFNGFNGGSESEEMGGGQFHHGHNGASANGGEELGLGFGGGCNSPVAGSSPTASGGKMDAFEDLLRFKAIQQQQQRSTAAALMMGDEFHKFGRCRPDRNDFGAMGFGSSNSSSRQIYLTFPADSTFKEEDVSNYFSMFGPVQDVRIPYQQKRMFGFVTFMLPETVKAILAKGNPHFVCDSRVLVKPYKEKGKIPDKKHMQQMERGDFSGCLSPTALDAAEPFDHIPFGARMFNHEMMLRRKLEERELQQAIDFQDRRLMNLQIADMKNHQLQRSLSLGVGVHAGIHSPTQMNQNFMFSSSCNNEEFVSEAKITEISNQDSMNSQSDECDPFVPPEVNEENSDQNENDKNESLELTLPDNLFASPTKSASTDQQTIFSTDMPETDCAAAVPINVTSNCQAVEM
ncbi:RNA-binding (RRM/RBD/RNP motifs) family protein [Artemisia annua]|uniref:RNA-binding (RRM/RBD/RNP motifs) family protein n=1 Tax=Artemisia annua TaxID=35608 RepID=A0A2U1LMJ7_ARTAN|nr:RNA-binding (RRM/RBD/RNP motifs) family protein [Artemisia annua]